MKPEDFIQLIRTCNLSQVRKALEDYKKLYPDNFDVLVLFYQHAAKQKK